MIHITNQNKNKKRGDPPAPAPAAMPEEIIKEEAPVEMVPGQEAPVVHEVILADIEPEPPQPRLFNMSWMENGPQELDDLDDDPNEGHSDMDESFPEDGSNDRD
jgi:hypothetical protein